MTSYPTPAGDPILRAASTASDPRTAARELADQLGGVDAAVRLVFASPEYELDALARELSDALGSAPLVGCTTAGEFGPGGYLAQPGISAVALPADDFQVDLVPIRRLSATDLSEFGRIAAEGVERHRSAALPRPRWRSSTRRPASFGVLLVDGLAAREEILTHVLNGALGGIPTCGGSAGDGLRFERTHLLLDGRFENDAAVLLLCRTTRPFERFRTQHFVATERRMVVTAADPSQRLVTEIDGLPAAIGYAQAVGLPTSGLDSQAFSTHPVVVRLGGDQYVRAVRQVEADEALSFFCAIDEGLVLTLASGQDMVANLEQRIDELRTQVGELEATLGFDCILRRLESQERELTADIDRALERLRACGFATYGEQFDGMHVNQTMTGIAIGRPGGGSDL